MNLDPTLWRFCTAPMMEWSDRHCRFLWRLLSHNARLYTEMVTTGAILKGNRERFLQFNPEEQPLALQLGGSNPAELSECAKIAEELGYQEINLNCGCPSDRVQNGKIGACLMAEPELVAECLSRMQAAVSIPVTVKHRIGIDEQDSEQDFNAFATAQLQAGCRVLLVHARKAWLQGLSPKQNREIPPLEYERVHSLKARYPDAIIVINGGLTTLAQCQQQLQHVDGVMVGREAYHNPYMMADVDHLLFDDTVQAKTRDQVLEAYIDYCAVQINKGQRLHHMAKHVLGLFAGEPGGRLFRRHISENSTKAGANQTVLADARKVMLDRLQTP